MKKLLLTGLIPTMILFGEKATQVQISESVNAVLNAHRGVTVSEHLTPHLIVLAQNLDSIPEHDIINLNSAGLSIGKIQGKLSMFTRPQLDYFYDTGAFRIHYDLTGINAIDSTDSDHDELPDYLQLVINALNDIQDIIISEHGYVFPPPDNVVYDEDYGGSAHYDIYLKSINSEYYGWTQPEYIVSDNPNSVVIEKNAATSYIVLRNNYDGFPNTVEGNIQVTIAHEFFHAVQFGYDYEDQVWFMEATSTWMEDQAFTDINDCYNYLPGWFRYPHYSLHDDISSHTWYGSFIFFQYISENLGGPEIVREFWKESVYYDGSAGNFTYTVIDTVLKRYGTDLSEAMTGMAISNRIMTPEPGIGPYAYSEAEGYNVLPANQKTIDYYHGDELLIENSTLKSFGSQYYAVNSEVPLKATLVPNTPGSTHLSLIGIMYKSSGLYWIQKGNRNGSVNIDPGQDTEYISLAIVSSDDSESDNGYSLTLVPGTSENPFIVSIVSPETFMISRNDSCSFNIYAYTDLNLTIAITDRFSELIRTLYEGNLEEGIHSFSWDGVGDNNSIQPSGTYYVRVSNRETGVDVYRSFTLISSSEINVSNPYPNPSSGEVDFSVVVGTTQFLDISVFDITGRKVASLASRYYSPGEAEFTWDGRLNNGARAPSGIYFIGVQGETENDFQKVTLIR